MSGFYIGSVRIPNRIALGPMAGVTDLPFRLLCKEQGAGLLYTEMVSAKAVTYRNQNTFLLLETDPKERPAAPPDSVFEHALSSVGREEADA